MTVFIGGSRRITRLSDDVTQRIDRIMDQRMTVIVGDAHGADKAAQDYLKRQSYDRVVVFCSGTTCRYNLGGWPVRFIKVTGHATGFRFYATKDRAMADEASIGLMVWDKQSAGTSMNVIRLTRQGKHVVVYIAPEKTFVSVKREADWTAIIARCSPELRRKVKRASSDESMSRTSFQGDLFAARE